MGSLTKDRFETANYPVIPDGSAPCPDDLMRRCLSDDEMGSLLNAYHQALMIANDKILWLGDALRPYTK